jgi:hypothetical protein
MRVSSHNIQFNETMNTNCTQHHVLRNSHNKMHFIAALRTHLETSGITVHQAQGDADRVIVDTALNLAETKSRVTIVAEDTDIRVMLVAHAFPQNNLFLLKPGIAQTQTKCTMIGNCRLLWVTCVNIFLFCMLPQAVTQHLQFSGRGKKEHSNY